MGKKGRNHSTDAKHIEVTERRTKELRMRIAGMTLRQIATQVGFSVQTVSDDIRIMLAEMSEEDRTQLRKIKLEEYANLKQRWTRQAYDGNEHAARLLMDILAAERKLYGLDAPEKSEVDLTTNEPPRPPVIVFAKSKSEDEQ